MKTVVEVPNAPNKKWIILLIRLVSIANLLVFVFSTDRFSNAVLFSLASRLLMVSNILIAVCSLARRRMSVRQFSVVAILFAMAGSAFISYLRSPMGGIGDFLIALFSYLAVPIYMVAIPELGKVDGVSDWLKTIAVVYALVFIVMAVFFPSYRIGTNALMLGYSNSNKTGAYMMLTVILLVLLYQNEKKMRKTIAVALECILLYLIVQTQSRTSFLIAAAVMIYALLPRTPRINRAFSIICILFPTVFYYLYAWVFSKGLFRDATILGRTIYSGRQIIDLQPLTLFGNYSSAVFGGLNVFRGISTTVGLMGIILWWVFNIRFIKSDFLDQNDAQSNRNLSRFCFAMLFLHGCTETCIFTGGTVFGGMVGCILIAIALNGRKGFDRPGDKEANYTNDPLMPM